MRPTNRPAITGWPAVIAGGASVALTSRVRAMRAILSAPRGGHKPPSRPAMPYTARAYAWSPRRPRRTAPAPHHLSPRALSKAPPGRSGEAALIQGRQRCACVALDPALEAGRHGTAPVSRRSPPRSARARESYSKRDVTGAPPSCTFGLHPALTTGMSCTSKPRSGGPLVPTPRAVEPRPYGRRADDHGDGPGVC